jgi:dihydropteroate synthase
MISLSTLAHLADTFRSDLDQAVAPLLVGDRVFNTDTLPAVMGCVNLSRDSTYRESIAPSVEAAVRKGIVLAAQGADFVDIGAESSGAKASRIGTREQITSLVPVIEQLSSAGIVVSAETYDPDVARACLKAGAKLLNFTGSDKEASIFEMVGEFDATIILCYVQGANVRDVTNAHVGTDPIPALYEYFDARIDRARALGAHRIVIDPGVGFFYGDLVEPMQRAQHQTQVLLNTFRLRRLGLPICHSMPHAFDLFEDQFRTAEGFFTVLGHLGGTGLFRTHEVPNVVAVLRALRSLGTGQI